MPKKVEKTLREEAKHKYPNDKERQNTYIYGTLRHKFGWKPKREQ